MKLLMCGQRLSKVVLRYDSYKWQLITMMHRTANENAAGLCRNFKRSDQPKIER